MLAEDGPAEGAFQLPKSLQQLYMEVPVKMRLPALLGKLSPCMLVALIFILSSSEVTCNCTVASLQHCTGTCGPFSLCSAL